MAIWKIEHFDIPTLTTFQTVYPENLNFQKRHRDVGDISYEISRSALDKLNKRLVYHDFLGPKRTGFRLFRNNYEVFAGVHSAVGGSFNGENVGISGHDWAWYFQNRHYPFNPASPQLYVAVYEDTDGLHYFGNPGAGSFQVNGVMWIAYGIDYARVVRRLLDVILGNPVDTSTAGGFDTFSPPLIEHSIPFSYDLPDIGATTNIRYDLGDTTDLLTLIEGLAGSYPGFEWDITPDRRFRMYYRFKFGPIFNALSDGDIDSVPLLWRFDKFQPPDDGDFTNNGPAGTHIFGYGQGLTHRSGQARGYLHGEEVFGRWDTTEDYGTEVTDARILERTEGDFALAINPHHDVSITVNPEEIPNFWTTFDTGLAIWINYDLDFHLIDNAYQILEMDCSVDNNGNEKVVLTNKEIFPETDLFGYEEA